MALHQPSCICDAYPFPHRAGTGKCPGTGWCPECFTPLEQITLFGRNEFDEQEYIDVCPDCGWRSE